MRPGSVYVWVCVCYAIAVDSWFISKNSGQQDVHVWCVLVEWVGYKRPMQVQCICMCYSITVTNWFHLMTINN